MSWPRRIICSPRRRPEVANYVTPPARLDRERVPRQSFLVLCLLVLAADVSGGQAPAAATVVQSNRSGTWSARTSSGRTLMGTWTAMPDSTGGTVTGTWALGDPRGSPVATGAWSAAKSPGQWTGAWRAIVSGRDGEYSGTWTSDVDLEVDASFGDLFEQAVQAVVSGTWRVGGQSGAWAIRSAKAEGAPRR